MYSVRKGYDNRNEVKEKKLKTFGKRMWTRRIQWLAHTNNVNVKLKLEVVEDKDNPLYREVIVSHADADTIWQRFKAGQSIDDCVSILGRDVKPNEASRKAAQLASGKEADTIMQAVEAVEAAEAAAPVPTAPVDHTDNSLAERLKALLNRDERFWRMRFKAGVMGKQMFWIIKAAEKGLLAMRAEYKALGMSDVMITVNTSSIRMDIEALFNQCVIEIGKWK